MVEVYMSSSMSMCKGIIESNIKTSKSAQEIIKNRKDKPLSNNLDKKKK